MGFSTLLSFPCGSEVKNLPAKKERQVQTLGRKDLGEGNGNPLQYSCLENPMDRGTWWAIVHGVTKSQTQLSDWTTTNKLLFTYCLICPRFVLWELLQPGSWVVWPCFRHILSTFLLCGTTRYSWSFLYFAWVSSRPGYFSRNPDSLIWITEVWCQDITLDVTLFLGPLMGQIQKHMYEY